jgi:CheY-like chemotaxis protein
MVQHIMNAKLSTAATILLVEDDDEVREGLTKLLLARGYRVVTACNEAQSIQGTAKSGSDVGLILIDQNMSSNDAIRARTQSQRSF